MLLYENLDLKSFYPGIFCNFLHVNSCPSDKNQQNNNSSFHHSPFLGDWRQNQIIFRQNKKFLVFQASIQKIPNKELFNLSQNFLILSSSWQQKTNRFGISIYELTSKVPLVLSPHS
jgi:hypothetical protein